MDSPEKMEDKDDTAPEEAPKIIEFPESKEVKVLNVSDTGEADVSLDKDAENAYSSLETRFASLWKNASEGAQNLQERMNIEERKSTFLAQLNAAKDNINTNESVQTNLNALEGQLRDLGEHVKNIEANIDFKSLSSQANKALDTLDSKLEGIELQAGKFVSLFTSFFTNMVKIDTPVTPEVKESEKIYSTSAVASAAYGSTRYDTDLFKLHTTESRFLDYSLDDAEELKAFDVETKTQEIASLLKTYPETLERIMNQLVPVKIAYDVFWYRYFKMESELKESEQKRKQLLFENDSSAHATENQGDQGGHEEEEEEEFTWDDEDEEDIENA